MRKELYNLLSSLRKSLGKKSENLGKTSGISGTLSAHSWCNLPIFQGRSNLVGIQFKRHFTTNQSSARILRVRTGVNSRAIWLQMERSAASVGLMYDWEGHAGHGSS